MNNNLERLINILMELRSESMQANPNNIRSVMDKYNMLFLGSNFNTILSIELLESLKSIFDFQIDSNELNKLIPLACQILNMKFEPMIATSDLGNPDAETICYNIILW